MTQVVGTVGALWRYPVKSMQGTNEAALVVGPDGIEGDRTWGVVDVGSGALLSAKRTSALLGARVVGSEVELPDGERITLGAPGVDEALSGWLGRPVRLVRAGSGGSLSYEMTFDPPNDDAEVFDIPVPEGTLLDLAAVHLVTSATLAGCAAQRPDLDWDVRRFRPNVVLDVEGEPFLEDAWIGGHLRIGGAVLSVGSPTVRCAMPLRAQPQLGDRGALDRQPGLYPAMTELHEAFPNHLGLYCDVVEPGPVAVGDEARLVEPTG